MFCINLIVVHIFFYKQAKFWPAEPQIFENQSNLVSNCRASNRKFLATWASNPLFCPIFVYFSLKSPKNVSNFIAILSLILGTSDSNSRLNRKMGLLIKKMCSLVTVLQRLYCGWRCYKFALRLLHNIW